MIHLDIIRSDESEAGAAFGGILHHGLKGEGFLLPIEVYDDVTSNGEQEGAMVIDLLPYDEGVPEPHEGVLGEIKRHFPVGGPQKAETEDRIRLTLINFPKKIFNTVNNSTIDVCIHLERRDDTPILPNKVEKRITV